MQIEKTKPVDQSATDVTLPFVTPLPGRAELTDQLVSGEVLPEATPARQLVAQYPMPAHQLGLPAAMRHGVAPDIAGVLAVTPGVRVPLRSLGLVADGDRAAMEGRGKAPCVDLGAQVGVMLAMEYTAGSRSHRLSNGTFSYVRPFSGDSSVGVRDRGADGDRDGDSAVGHAAE
jgi:hypothetical protein